MSDVNDAALIGQEMFRVSVLPARAAYLVKPQSRKGLRRAVQEASTRWGGATEPIVPVPARSKVGPWWRRLIEVARVDGLVNVDVEADRARSVASDLGLPLVDLASIDRGGITQFTCHPAHLFNSQTRDIRTIARHDSDLWEVVAIGDLTPDHEADMSDSGLSVTRPAASDWAARAQVSARSLLDATLTNFDEHGARGWTGPYPALIWVTKPNNFNDCLWFWNLRALRALRFNHTPMLLLPHQGVKDWSNFPQQVEELLRRSEDVEPDVIFGSTSAHIDHIKDLADCLNLHETDKKPRSKRTFPLPPPKEPPYTFATNLDVRGSLLFERTYGRVTNVTSQIYNSGTLIEGDCPVAFSQLARTLVKIDSKAFAHIPRRPPLAKLILEKSTWAVDDRLQFATQLYNRFSIRLRVPPPSDVVTELLRSSHIELAISDKGQLGLRLHDLKLLDVLTIPGVPDVIRSLQTPRSSELARELRRLTSDGNHNDARLVETAMAWGGRAERRHQSIGELSLPNDLALNAIEALVQARWAERGLTIDCSSCTLRSFVRLGTAPEAGSCEACGASQSYKLSSAGPEIRYRLHALLDRASDQGVVPHLQTYAVLRKVSNDTWLLPSINLVGHGSGHPAEVDLFGIHRGAVLAGEVKTNSKQFDTSQIERDIELSRLLRADCHVMAASSGSFTAVQIKQARDLAEKSAMEVLVVERNSVRELGD